jgi:hypothetical protein
VRLYTLSVALLSISTYRLVTIALAGVWFAWIPAAFIVLILVHNSRPITAAEVAAGLGLRIRAPKLRKRAARTVRHLASRSPRTLKQVLLRLADAIHPRTALTCRHCGTRIEFRGSIHEQADRAYLHANTHYSEEPIQ